jgi:HTH-type transcriptional regulator/antitoxin MqsA
MHSPIKVVKMKTPSVSCPLCGVGHWVAYNDGEFKFRHGRKDYIVKEQEYAICDHCNTKGFLPGQRNANRASISAFQSFLPEYISPSDVLAVREKYCLTQADATKIFGGGKLGFSKWERGTATPSGTTARLLKLALNFPQAMKYLCEQANVSLSHERVSGQNNGANVVALYEMINRDTSQSTDVEKVEFLEECYTQDDLQYK